MNLHALNPKPIACVLASSNSQSVSEQLKQLHYEKIKFFTFRRVNGEKNSLPHHLEEK